jgi:hypothetical protein
MRDLLPVVALCLVAAILLMVFMWWRLRSRDRLSAAAQRELRAQWKHAQSLQDPVRRVLEAEKVIDRLLQALGYTGSFGDKLKAAGPRLPNLDALWSAHKLRNHLAHVPGATVSNGDANRALAAFQKTYTRFVRD